MNPASDIQSHNVDVRAVKQLLQQRTTAAMLNELLAACGPHQRVLLSMLAISEHFKIDLDDLLPDLIPELPNSYQPLVRNLAEQVSAGATPLTALQAVPELLPTAAMLALQLASENDTLPDMYSGILKRHHDPASELTNERQQILNSIMRLCGTCMAMLIVTIYIFIKILPEFSDLLEEFGLQPTASLKLLDQFARSPIMLLTMIVLPIVFLPFSLPVLFDFLRSWNPHRWQSKRLVASAERRRSLAWVTSAGNCVSDRTQNLSGLRLDEANPVEASTTNDQNKEQPSGMLSSVVRNFVSRSEGRAIAAAGSRETQGWLLKWFAINYQRRHLSRSMFWVRLIVGVVNVILGLFVLLIALAIFSTLISIINGLSEW